MADLLDPELKEKLFNLLRQNEDEFIAEFEKIPPDEAVHYANCLEANKSNTLLQVACYMNHKNAVELLLENGADPTQTTVKNKRTPLEITVNRGYNRVFQVLLNSNEVDIKSNDLLIELLHRISKTKEPQRRFFKTCFDIYMSSNKKPDINLRNEKGVTPLEYAAKYCSQDLVLDLLKNGASLAARCRNENSDLVVQLIDPNTLKKHLDQCLEVDMAYLKSNDDKDTLKVCYNYKSLMAPRKEKNEEDDSKKPSRERLDRSVDDLDAVLSQKYTKSLSKLHEVVKIEEHSFLMDMKDPTIQSEMEVISCICNTPELKHLIRHPVISSFVFMKWRQVSWFYNVNRLRLVTTFVLFVLQALSFQILYSNLTIILIIARFCLLFTYLIHLRYAVKGGFLGTSILYFLVNDLPEMTCYILILLLPPAWGKSLSAVMVFFLAFRVLFYLGQHTTHVQMFKVVTSNFIIFLLTYTILVFAYGISVFTLINVDLNSVSLNSTNTQGGWEIPFSLATLGEYIYYTFLMLVGDLRVTQNQLPSIPIVTHAIFIIFVFIVPLNLLNFLNGLAVADVQEVREEAELAGLKSKISLITSLEEDLIGINNKLRKRTFLHSVHTALKSKIQGILQIKSAKRNLAKQISLFPYVLQDYKLEVYPNMQGKIKLNSNNKDNSDSSFTKRCKCFSFLYKSSNLRLDPETTTNTFQLIREKKAVSSDKKDDHLLLKQLEDSVTRIKVGQKMLLQKLDAILSNVEKRERF